MSGTAEIIGKDSSGVLTGINSVTKNGRTSIHTVAGFSDTQTIYFDVSTSSASIAYMLIDLSDTTSWKHANTGEIIIEYIIININSDTNFTGDCSIGYLANVDATNGDFSRIVHIPMERKSDLVHEVIDFGSHGFHCNDNSHFGVKSLNNSLFQTDVNLAGPDDSTTLTYPSGNGDLVFLITGDGTNTVEVTLTIGYETTE